MFRYEAARSSAEQCAVSACGKPADIVLEGVPLCGRDGLAELRPAPSMRELA